MVHLLVGCQVQDQTFKISLGIKSIGGFTLADISKPEKVTPFSVCTCAKCGPPWRNDTDDWKTGGLFDMGAMWMTLCPECGNKRCPGAADHTLPCSHSNDPEENAKAWAWLR